MCDTCNSEMYGYFWMSCENGHIMGEEYEEKGKKKMWTATCDDAQLTEVSVVGRGADPDAKITKKLKDDLIQKKVSTNQLYVLSELYNLDLNRFCHQLGYDPDRYKRQYSIPKRGKTMADQNDRDDLDTSTSQDTDNNDGDSARDQLRRELTELKEKYEELQEEMQSMYSAEEYEAVQKQVTQLQQQITDFEKAEKENAEAIELGEAALSAARDYARRSYVAMRTGTEDDSELQNDAEYARIQRKINNSRDVDSLYEDGHDWRSIANSRRPAGRQSHLEHASPLSTKKSSQAEKRFKGLNNF